MVRQKACGNLNPFDEPILHRVIEGLTLSSQLRTGPDLDEVADALDKQATRISSEH